MTIKYINKGRTNSSCAQNLYAISVWFLFIAGCAVTGFHRASFFAVMGFSHSRPSSLVWWLRRLGLSVLFVLVFYVLHRICGILMVDRQFFGDLRAYLLPKSDPIIRHKYETSFFRKINMDTKTATLPWCSWMQGQCCRCRDLFACGRVSVYHTDR